MEYLNGNELYWGHTIDDAYEKLQLEKSKGNKYQITFNEQLINCDMTLDHCYQLLTGKTKAEFEDELKKRAEQYKKEKEEHKANIPELTKKWKKWGKENLPQDKQELWGQCVPIRLEDLYQGWELNCFKEIFEAYKSGKTKKEIKKIMEDQGHSGMSWGLMCSIIHTFLNEKLANYLHNI